MAIRNLNFEQTAYTQGEGASATLDIDGALKEVKEKAVKASG